MLSLFSFVQLLVGVRGLVPVLNRRRSKECFTIFYLLQFRPYISSFLEMHVVFGSRTPDMMNGPFQRKLLMWSYWKEITRPPKMCKRQQTNPKCHSSLSAYFCPSNLRGPCLKPTPYPAQAPMQATRCESSTSSPVQLSSPQDSTPACTHWPLARLQTQILH